MSLADYTIEFEELLYCLERYEIKLLSVVLAYRYLNSANFTEVLSSLLGPTYQIIPMAIWQSKSK